MIVLEPGQRWDPARDFVFVSGLNLPERLEPMVNGVATEAPVEISLGGTVRLRFIDSYPTDDVTFKLTRDTTLVEWQVVAKDGFDLPAPQAARGPVRKWISVDEIFDAKAAPSAEGTFVPTAWHPSGAGDELKYERRFVVRRLTPQEERPVRRIRSQVGSPRDRNDDE